MPRQRTTQQVNFELGSVIFFSWMETEEYFGLLISQNCMLSLRRVAGKPERRHQYDDKYDKFSVRTYLENLPICQNSNFHLFFFRISSHKSLFGPFDQSFTKKCSKMHVCQTDTGYSFSSIFLTSRSRYEIFYEEQLAHCSGSG